MDSLIDALKMKGTSIASQMNTAFTNKGIEVRNEYSRDVAENPLWAIVMTVGVKSFKQTGPKMSRYLGKSLVDNSSLYGIPIEVTYRITVHIPISYTDAAECEDVALVVDWFNSAGYNVSEIVSDETTYDRSTRGAIRHIDVTVRTLAEG